MSRKNRTPEENARRAKIRELLQEANIASMADIQNLFRETIAEFIENGLEAGLDEELGYSKYDFYNKETDNSRNGYSLSFLKASANMSSRSFFLFARAISLFLRLSFCAPEHIQENTRYSFLSHQRLVSFIFFAIFCCLNDLCFSGIL